MACADTAREGKNALIIDDDRMIAANGLWFPEFAPVRKTDRFKAFVRKASLVDTGALAAGPSSAAQWAQTISSAIEVPCSELDRFFQQRTPPMSKFTTSSKSHVLIA